jgi:uncharacterized protein YndB with AHSA1/START domain
MAKSCSPLDRAQCALRLVVRRTIAATPERVFEAWTQPQQLKQWWGPPSVVCSWAEVDLRVGGRYRVANRFPDGKILWITGEFEVIEPPRKLTYTWRLEADAGPTERVHVTFEARAEGTEVVVTHERIADRSTHDQHEQGWIGCLDKLVYYLSHGGALSEAPQPT